MAKNEHTARSGNEVAGALTDGAELESRIASVLHRLRTPLTAIKGWNELARRARPEERSTYLDQTASAIIVMQSAIDEIAEPDRSGSADPDASPKRQAESVQPPAMCILSNQI